MARSYKVLGGWGRKVKKECGERSEEGRSPPPSGFDRELALLNRYGEAVTRKESRWLVKNGGKKRGGKIQQRGVKITGGTPFGAVGNARITGGIKRA